MVSWMDVVSFLDELPQHDVAEFDSDKYSNSRYSHVAPLIHVDFAQTPQAQIRTHPSWCPLSRNGSSHGIPDAVTQGISRIHAVLSPKLPHHCSRCSTQPAVLYTSALNHNTPAHAHTRDHEHVHTRRCRNRTHALFPERVALLPYTLSRSARSAKTCQSSVVALKSQTSNPHTRAPRRRMRK